MPKEKKQREISNEDKIIVFEYLQNGFNRAAAYRKYHPGCTEKASYELSRRLFSKPEVKLFVSEFCKKVADRDEISAAKTMLHISKIAYAPIDGKVNIDQKLSACNSLGKIQKLFKDDGDVPDPDGGTVNNYVTFMLPDNGFGPPPKSD